MVGFEDKGAHYWHNSGNDVYQTLAATLNIMQSKGWGASHGWQVEFLKSASKYCTYVSVVVNLYFIVTRQLVINLLG